MSAAPPWEAVVASYVAEVRRHYGGRFDGAYLFGSRARGDFAEDSDADLAIVLGDSAFDFWAEKDWLTDLAYDILLSTRLYIQAWPFTAGEWATSSSDLVASARRDARPVPGLS